MKAAVVSEANAPWKVESISEPEPGPGEVLVRVEASGLCYGDVHLTRGEFPTTYPRVLGHETAGEVAAVGPGVSTRRPGDRVGVVVHQSSCGRCEWCARGKPSFCPGVVYHGIGKDGGHAELTTALASQTVLLPEGLSADEAAPLMCAGHTVWSALRQAEPQPGERVAVAGIGGLGHLGIQLSKAAGFTTYALTRSEAKVELAQGLGADAVFTTPEELGAAGGADVILYTGLSYEAATDLLQGLRPEGRFMLVGFDGAASLAVTGMSMFQQHRIIGSVPTQAEHLFEVLEMAAAGRVRAHCQSFALDDAPEAYERVVGGDVQFRAVLRP